MGWQGHLQLDYRSKAGRTIALDRHHGPQRVLQRLYPEGDAVCHHVLVHPPGGIVGGDVLELDATNNRVVVGDESQLNRDSFTVANCNWIPWAEPPASFECVAKIRYNPPGAAATVTPGTDGTATVKLHQPARAVTPGQACVFYGGDEGDLVLGGGWIGR